MLGIAKLPANRISVIKLFIFLEEAENVNRKVFCCLVFEMTHKNIIVFSYNSF